MVKSGDWAVMGGLNFWTDTVEQRGLFNLFESNSKQLRDAVILVRAVKLGGVG